MTLKGTLVVTAFVLVASALTSAQQPVKFTSVYTTLNGKGCRTLRGGQGTDDATLCKGVGGYDIEVYYSAAAMQIGAIRERDQQMAGIAILDLDFEYGKSRLEWRLANGKPYALIMRVPLYGEPKEGEYFGNVVGQRLIVAGLIDYDFNETIDAKLPDANTKAREAADRAFVAKR
jgi:hypothetical protein